MHVSHCEFQRLFMIWPRPWAEPTAATEFVRRFCLCKQQRHRAGGGVTDICGNGGVLLHTGSKGRQVRAPVWGRVQRQACPGCVPCAGHLLMANPERKHQAQRATRGCGGSLVLSIGRRGSLSGGYMAGTHHTGIQERVRGCIFMLLPRVGARRQLEGAGLQEEARQEQPPGFPHGTSPASPRTPCGCIGVQVELEVQKPGGRVPDQLLRARSSEYEVQP